MDMGLSGKDLLSEMQNMGIPRPQAERWVREAAREERVATSVSPAEIYNAPSPMEEKLPSQPQLPKIEPRARTKQTFAQEAAATQEVPQPPKVNPPPEVKLPAKDTITEKLWEKGILTAVDAKLEKMEQLKKNIDRVIENKVDEHYEEMEKKMEALFDAQRELLRMKMDGQIASKVKEVDDIISQKIEEMRQLNLSTKEDLQRAKGQKIVMQDIMTDIQQKIGTLDDTKRIISTDVHRKLEELEEKTNRMLDTTEERIQRVEERATKTLELEEKITQGLTEQIQNQANQILEERIKDLRGELKKEIIELKKLGSELTSKDIQQILQEFKELNAQMQQTKLEIDAMVEHKAREMDSMMEKKMLSMDKIVNIKMETIVNTKEKDFFQKIENQAQEIAQTKRELAQKLIEAETIMQNVNMFEKQFVENLKKTNMEREDQAKQFKQKLTEFEAKADEKIQLMETKQRQLDVVVGQLSRLVNQWMEQRVVGGNTGIREAIPPSISAAPEIHKETKLNEKKTEEEPRSKKEKRNRISEFFKK